MTPIESTDRAPEPNRRGPGLKLGGLGSGLLAAAAIRGLIALGGSGHGDAVSPTLVPGVPTPPAEDRYVCVSRIDVTGLDLQILAVDPKKDMTQPMCDAMNKGLRSEGDDYGIGVSTQRVKRSSVTGFAKCGYSYFNWIVIVLEKTPGPASTFASGSCIGLGEDRDHHPISNPEAY